METPAGEPYRLDDDRAMLPGYTHFGRSLLPIMTGNRQGTGIPFFCKGGRVHGETHAMEREIPSGIYWPRESPQSSADSEHTKAVMCRTQTHKYVRRLYEKDKRYDLVNDPQELHNQIDNPVYAGVLITLKDRLRSFDLETADVVRHEPDQR